MARFIGGAVSFLDDGDGTNALRAAGDQPHDPSPTPPVRRSRPTSPGSPRSASSPGSRTAPTARTRPVLRDQMASFIARAYAYAVDEGLGMPGGAAGVHRDLALRDHRRRAPGGRRGRRRSGAVSRARPAPSTSASTRSTTSSASTSPSAGVTGDYASPAVTATHIHAEHLRGRRPAGRGLPEPAAGGRFAGRAAQHRLPRLDRAVVRRRARGRPG